jgi:hypothetical protein
VQAVQYDNRGKEAYQRAKPKGVSRATNKSKIKKIKRREIFLAKTNNGTSTLNKKREKEQESSEKYSMQARLFNRPCLLLSSQAQQREARALAQGMPGPQMHFLPSHIIKERKKYSQCTS